MINILKKAKSILSLGVIGILTLLSCNKEFENLPENPVTPPPAAGTTINDIINNDTSFSFFKAAVAKAGLGATLSSSSQQLTLYLPDNNAFRRSGIPSVSVINNNAVFDTATIRSIVRYHLTPQQVALTDTFPNVQIPTLLNPAPNLSAFLRLTAFPSKRGANMWVNNIPVTAAGMNASNGVIYKVAALVAPPNRSIHDIITADSDLSFFVAALNRADSGRTTIATGSLTEALKSIGANLTLFAPNNNAFSVFLAAQGLPPSEAVFALMPVNTVRAIVSYHILGFRTFSVNVPANPLMVKTLLNSAIPNHPGVALQSTFTGPVVTQFRVTGAANGGVSALVINQDNHATNGVVHKIDRVLRPM